MSVAEDQLAVPGHGGRAPGAEPPDPGAAGQVRGILERVREHLGMDIAFISDFTGGTERIVTTSEHTGGMSVTPGGERPLDGTYCVRVLAGTLPPVIADARTHPVTRELAATHEVGIGAYIGAPLRGPDGGTVGMLCCLNRGPNALLDEDAVRVIGLAAALVEDRLGAFGLPHRPGVSDRVRRVREVLAGEQVQMVYQPVVRLVDDVVVGVEALARFEPTVFPTPVHAFTAASCAGLGPDLELLAVRKALEGRAALPDDVLLSVNLSVEALLDPRTVPVLLAHGGAGVGVEITEHTPVGDYPAVLAVTQRLRAAGVRVAVDDAGAGFASLRHVLQLRPDAIKLDIDLVRGIDTDPVRQALARAVGTFAAALPSWLVAEGIETEEERQALLDLGVVYGQGYLLGRPGPLPVA